jgi:hypothetical protein
MFDYSVQESGRTTCDLDAFEEYPALLLIGENHDVGSSKTVKKYMAKAGAQGAIFAAFETGLEHPAFPWDTAALAEDFKVELNTASRIFVVDSPLAYALTRNYNLIGYMDQPPEDLENVQWGGRFASYCRLAHKNPYARRAWEEAVASSPDFQIFSLAGEERCEDWKRASADIPAKTFRLFATANNEAFVSMVNEKFLPAMGLSRPLEPYREDPLMSFFYRQSMSRSASTVMSSVRDRDMADNIAAVYCRAAAEHKNMVVSVGRAHIDGILQRLEDWSNDRIPLRTAKSYGEDQFKNSIFDGNAVKELGETIKALSR